MMMIVNVCFVLTLLAVLSTLNELFNSPTALWVDTVTPMVHMGKGELRRVLQLPNRESKPT